MTTDEIRDLLLGAQIDDISGSLEWQEGRGWLVGVMTITLDNGVELSLLGEPLGVTVK